MTEKQYQDLELMMPLVVEYLRRTFPSGLTEYQYRKLANQVVYMLSETQMRYEVTDPTKLAFALADLDQYKARLDDDLERGKDEQPF
jgi:hypothetical protein